MQNVIFHVDDTAALPLALGNAANLHAYYKAQGQPCTAELLVNGPAVTALTPEGSGAESLKKAMAGGLTVVACANALRANGLPASALLPGVRVVPAGVVELAERQAQGWAYIKP